jgi:O-acetyl-ADP-ribose deacetylase (regulator of RNase III)
MSIGRLIAIATVLAAAAWAQTASPSSGTQPSTAAINQQNANNLCRVYFTKPKAGQAAQYEAGRKKHNQFHASQHDTWTWNTYTIETGDNTGNYVISTCGHSWKDFDDWEAKMGKADLADAAVNLAPASESTHDGFYLYRADMSLAPANQPPAPMTAVTIFALHPQAAADFIGAIKQINDALQKQPDWPKTSGWLQLVNGGEGPTFVLLSGKKNWADFAPQSKSVADVLTETYGKEQSDAILKTLRDTIAHVYTETATYRPDLSYTGTK